MFFGQFSSPLGQISLQSADGLSLCALGFEENCQNALRNCAIFDEAKRWLELYFSGVCPDFTPKLDLGGSAFRLAVLAEVRKIKYATSTSYGDIAKHLAQKLGKEKIAARAVGKAVGANPVLLIIPCHRVLGSDFLLRGYSAALWRKKELLKLEKIAFKE